MSSKRSGALGALIAFTLIVAAVLGAAFITPPAQTAAESIIGSKSATLVTSLGATTNVTTDAAYTQFYGTGDCYSTYVAAVSPATATVTLYHSADGSNWVAGTSMTAQSSAGTVHTRTVLYGAYTRAIIAPSNTNAMTMTVKCVWKNTES
jgi:hypothetical protein